MSTTEDIYPAPADENLPGKNFTLNATSDTGSVSGSIPLNYPVKEKSRLPGSTGEGAAVDLSSRGDITVEELQPQ